MEKDCYKLRKWQKRCALATWLKVCGFQSAGSFFRSKTNIFFEESFEASTDKPELKNKSEIIDELVQQELMEKIKQIIDQKLTERERLIITFCFLDELSYEEILKIMHIPIDNLYLIKYRALKKIRKYLENIP